MKNFVKTTNPDAVFTDLCDITEKLDNVIYYYSNEKGFEIADVLIKIHIKLTSLKLQRLEEVGGHQELVVIK